LPDQPESPLAAALIDPSVRSRLGVPGTAMLLAAGLGTRMRPLTEETAKPLLTLAGRSLLDHALDRLAGIGVRQVVVNAHWQADRVAEHLAGRAPPPETMVRREAALLDTGGAVRAALHEGVLGRERGEPAPFYVVNGDAYWLDGPSSMLGRLAAALDETADGVLLLHRSVQVQADIGFGDFLLDPWGRPRRRAPHEVAPYVFAGVQLLSPALFEAAPEGAFSMNLLWDRAAASGRLRAVVHDGLWFHLSTPADLAAAEHMLLAGETGETR
jgi:MurNAc alpha-1-phosphate uridylyltransferase